MAGLRVTATDPDGNPLAGALWSVTGDGGFYGTGESADELPLGNQTVLLRGVNDDPHTMRRLMQKLLAIRVKPYYLYQADLVLGTEHFRTTVEEGLEILRGLRGYTSGMAVPAFVIDAPGGGGKMARSAGTSVQLVAKEGDYATLRLPSTEMRRVPIDCRATVGSIGNSDHELVKIGKAGRNRWKGKRFQTRGVAMNPVDHPHGGGEGKTSGGRHPVTPWGKPTKGYKTRKKRKDSNKYIVKRRR